MMKTNEMLPVKPVDEKHIDENRENRGLFLPSGSCSRFRVPTPCTPKTKEVASSGSRGGPVRFSWWVKTGAFFGNDKAMALLVLKVLTGSGVAWF